MNSMNRKNKDEKITKIGRRVVSMKNFFKKLKVIMAFTAFLGGTGVSMTALTNEPVLAAESYVRKTGDETGYTIPKEITIKKGETKTITLNVPKCSTDVTNVAWGHQTNGCFSYIESKPGSYWGKKAYITIKGTDPGTGYINSQASVFKTKGNPDSYKYTAHDRCVVKVVDGTEKKDTKKPLRGISLNKSSAVLAKGNTLNLKVSYAPSDTTDSKSVYWSSSNSFVASVKNGKVTAVKPGTAVITARVGNKTAKCTITVNIPLQSISLSKTALSLKAGENAMLYYTNKPSDTTEKGGVSWSSNNTAVATVSGGRVVAKKAGTATITARLGEKTATCKVTVGAASGKNNTSSSKTTSTKESYKNVSEAYTLTNQFRTTKSNQWYWNANNRTKTYTYGLKALTRDVALENIAKQRAKEQWTQYYVKGKKTHDRLNGSSCWTAYTKGSNPCAENLAWGHKDCRTVIVNPNNGWAETFKKYADQGHRRNMLKSEAKRVGIACYEKDGKTCWAMCLGW